MDTVTKILESAKKRREITQSVETLRRRLSRKVYPAVINFVLAVFWIWRCVSDGLTQKVGEKDVVLFGGFLSLACAVLMIISGILQLWVNPRDKLLLMLAEEVLENRQGPNQALLPTTTAVTSAATHPPRQL